MTKFEYKHNIIYFDTYPKHYSLDNNVHKTSTKISERITGHNGRDNKFYLLNMLLLITMAIPFMMI